MEPLSTSAVYVKKIIVTPAVYSRLLGFHHSDMQSTGQKSHCVNMLDAITGPSEGRRAPEGFYVADVPHLLCSMGQRLPTLETGYGYGYEQGCE